MFDYQGKTALITGASRGLGKALAQQLAAAGVTVVLVARQQTELDEVVNSIRQQGKEVIIIGIGGAARALCAFKRL